MHQLIASYLFQNKSCPLPGLGTLTVHVSGAKADFATQQIAPPEPFIQFSDRETNASGLLGFIAATTNINTYEVTEALGRFCNDLKKGIAEHAKAALNGIGNFVVDNNGNIIFEQSALPLAFLQPVFAERVIHPQAEHHILVGDKETTNTLMTELLSEKPGEKDRWWVWAIVLGTVGLLLLLLYFSQLNGTSPFGNALKI